MGRAGKGTLSGGCLLGGHGEPGAVGSLPQNSLVLPDLVNGPAANHLVPNAIQLLGPPIHFQQDPRRGTASSGQEHAVQPDVAHGLLLGHSCGLLSFDGRGRPGSDKRHRVSRHDLLPIAIPGQKNCHGDQQRDRHQQEHPGHRKLTNAVPTCAPRWS